MQRFEAIGDTAQQRDLRLQAIRTRVDSSPPATSHLSECTSSSPPRLPPGTTLKLSNEPRLNFLPVDDGKDGPEVLEAVRFLRKNRVISCCFDEKMRKRK